MDTQTHADTLLLAAEGSVSYREMMFPMNTKMMGYSICTGSGFYRRQTLVGKTVVTHNLVHLCEDTRWRCAFSLPWTITSKCPSPNPFTLVVQRILKLTARIWSSWMDLHRRRKRILFEIPDHNTNFQIPVDPYWQIQIQVLLFEYSSYKAPSIQKGNVRH